MFENICGKVIAVVYIFENEDAAGFGHYDIWKSEVITGWLNAIEAIKCIPYILDTRTFVNKAMNRTLPVIDYVINLNAGNDNLSTLGFLPSICSFLGIPCIPANTNSVIVGENKKVANCIAEDIGVKIPQELLPDSKDGIFRPLNYGSSRGVKRGYSEKEIPGIYQEFIPGFDITTPLMFNPATQKMELLPTLIYQSSPNSTEWYLGENEKATHSGFKRYPVNKISSELAIKYQELADAFMITTFCRIDARIRTERSEDFEHLRADGINLENTYFIEMNPLPTIRMGNNYSDSMKYINQDNPFYEPWNIYQNQFSTTNEIGFILCCAMKGLSKSKY